MNKIEDVGAATFSVNNSVSLTENDQSTVQLSLKSHCYTWTINDFHNCLKFRQCQFNSPSFIFQDTEWRLRLCVLTANDKVNNMKIGLQSKSNIDSDLYFRNSISIVDDDDKVISQADVEFCANENVLSSAHVYLVAPWDSESFVLPNKLTVRCKFSSLISEISEDTKSALGKSDNLKESDSQCGTKGDKSVSPPPKRRTTRSASPRSPRTLSKSSLLNENERLRAEIKEHLRPFLVIICISMALLILINPNLKQHINDQFRPDKISTFKSNEINYLIYDSTKKLNLISEALNLTSVKEKSLEILALYSNIYNGTNHVQPIMQNIESNMTHYNSINNDTEKSI